jgi:two-component system response regulator HydG
MMMMSRFPIMIVDEDDQSAADLAAILQRVGHSPDRAAAAPGCLAQLSAARAAIVLIDTTASDEAGLELCRVLRDRAPHAVPIIVTRRRETTVAIAAMRAGAYDYLVKPISPAALELAVRRAGDQLALRLELERLRGLADARHDMIAESAAIQRVLELVRRIATTDATVLITGESGVGKEQIARALHRFSERRDHPFVAINCSAMPLPLLESELFGHVRGAFSGAERERVGLLLQAGGGTILLDEIAEMPLEMQAKLLRVLQERRVRPVGGDVEVRLDARIVAATSRELELEVALRRFRSDLYHRINVVTVEVPPLRARRDDILPLAHHLLHRSGARLHKEVRGMTAPTARALLDYSWPGNVRELENCIERAVAVCRLDQITIDDLPERVVAASTASARRGGGAGVVTLTEMKLSYLRKALELCRGNKSLTAKLLDIDRRTISNLLVSPNREQGTENSER